MFHDDICFKTWLVSAEFEYGTFKTNNKFSVYNKYKNSHIYTLVYLYVIDHISLLFVIYIFRYLLIIIIDNYTFIIIIFVPSMVWVGTMNNSLVTYVWMICIKISVGEFRMGKITILCSIMINHRRVVPAPDGILFPFLRDNDLRSSLLNIRAHSFLLSCT